MVGPRVGGSAGRWARGLVGPRVGGSAVWWVCELVGPRVDWSSPHSEKMGEGERGVGVVHPPQKVVRQSARLSVRRSNHSPVRLLGRPAVRLPAHSVVRSSVRLTRVNRMGGLRRRSSPVVLAMPILWTRARFRGFSDGCKPIGGRESENPRKRTVCVYIATKAGPAAPTRPYVRASVCV